MENIPKEIPIINYKQKEKQYAFTIDMKHKNSLGNKVSSNGQRVRGFYDDLINYDYQIRKDKKQIKQHKIEGIKESVYSNKAIPNVWRDKIDYYRDCCRTLSSDRNFISYLGKGNEYDNLKKTKDYLTIETTYKTEPKDLNFRNLKKTSSELLTDRNLTFSHHTNKMSKPTSTFYGFNPHKNTLITDERRIRSIFDDLKTMYPLQLPNKKGDIDDNEECNEDVIEHSVKGCETERTKRSSQAKQREKRAIFQSTMYSNLLSSYGLTDKKPVKKPKKKEYTTLYLNSNTEEFYNVPDIKNKKIDMKLRDINYYGPHFSYCPPCRRKNNNFYNQMEIKQCLKLLTYIKSQRRKI